MTTAPPQYTTGDSPPSYEEVIKKLAGLVGEDPTADRVLKGAQKLSSTDVEVLVQEHSEHYPLQTDKQKYDFAVGLCQETTSNDAKAYLEAGASNAVAAAREIDLVFSNLDRKIAEVDEIHHSDFRPKLLEIQKDYRQVMEDSQTLATEINVSAQDFDDVLVGYWANRQYPIDQRKEGVDEHIKTCNGFKTKANEIEKQHQKLIDAFAALVTSFSKWAKDKEGQLTEEIKKIDEDLVALKKKLTALNASATAIGLATGVALGVIALLMTAFQPWTSVLLIAGLITAGVGFGTTAGLIIAAGLVQNEITEKENKKQKLEDQIEEIRRARESLETVGQASLLSFNQCLAVISASQKATIEDAEDIRSWLENGAPREDRPQYMKMHQDAGVRSYKAMGSYLDRYAKGITRYRAQGGKK